MIFMGERRPEQRHDSVPHDLVDRALVAVDGLHHQLEYGIKKLACLLGIAVCEQLHRAFHVGEQHRDLLALAFDRGARIENAFGQMARHRGLQRARCVRQRLRRVAALGTELGGRRKLGPTTGVDPRERRGAFHAEPGARRVLLLALRASHVLTCLRGNPPRLT